METLKKYWYIVVAVVIIAILFCKKCFGKSKTKKRTKYSKNSRTRKTMRTRISNLKNKFQSRKRLKRRK
jgi:hypothetical protein